MTIYDACDIGYNYGLDTVGACVDNICANAYTIFEPDDVKDELFELLFDVMAHNYNNSTSVERVLGREKMDEIDKAINDKVFSPHIVN